MSSSAYAVTTNQCVRTQPPIHRYRLRLQALLQSVRTENAGSCSKADSIRNNENGVQVATHSQENTEPVHLLVEHSATPRT